jgi:hypothetical protein
LGETCFYQTEVAEMTLDIEVTSEVSDRIAEIGRSVAVPKRLTREECTTPELRLEYIAQWLEAGGDERHGVAGFDMGLIYQTKSCGTVCCIGGAALRFFSDGDYADLDKARRLLGFGPEGRIFTPRGWLGDSSIFTPAWAARCIRKYQRTGVVDWEGTRTP